MAKVSAANIEADYALILAAAIAGERCPISNPHGPIHSGSIIALADQKRIRSDVYSKNWRVVTIMDGEHKGKATAPCPWGGSPYLVNGVHVDRIRRRFG